METRKFFNDELNRLRQDILAMATMAEENLSKAISALRSHNFDLAQEVCNDDAKIDALQTQIEDDAAMLISTQQPVARDLREIVTIYKLTSNIERIGDYSVHLARAVKKLIKKEESALSVQTSLMQASLEKMAKTGQIMIRTAIESYMKQNVQMARDAAAMDNVIDEEHKALTEKILKIMKKNPDMIKSAYKILYVSGQLERLGDHTTNICEAVIYMVQGKHEELNE